MPIVSSPTRSSPTPSLDDVLTEGHDAGAQPITNLTELDGGASQSVEFSGSGDTTVNAGGTGSVGLGTNRGSVNVTGSAAGTPGVLIQAGGGSIQVATATSEVLGFYGATGSTQPSAIIDAAGGLVIDVEARTALNTLLATARTLGLIHA